MGTTDPVYDFHNFFMSAVIVSKDGDRTPLGIRTEDVGKPTGAATADLVNGKIFSLPFLSELTVETQLADIPIMKATLTPPYREAIALLESRLIEFGSSSLEVQFGYVGASPAQTFIGPTWTGLILTPNIQLGREISITYSAHGVGGFKAVREKSSKIYTDATRMHILLDLVDLAKPVNGKNFVLDLDDLKGTPENDLLDKELPSFAVKGRTIWNAIWDLIRDMGCWLHIVGEKLVITPRTKLKGNPKFVLSLYDYDGGVIGVNQFGERVFPILGVTSPTMGVYLPAESAGYQRSNFSADDGTTGSPELTDDKDSPATTGAGDAGHKEFIKPVNYYGEKSSEDEVKAAYNKSRTGMGININIDTIGVPDLLPGDVVNVRGLGNRISGAKVGDYGVHTVIHTLGRSGYTTSMNLWSNTSALYGAGVPAKQERADTKPENADGVVAQPKQDQGV